MIVPSLFALLARTGRRLAVVVLLVLAVGAAAPATYGQNEAVYIVQQGDTLYKIARENGLTVEALKTLNGLTSDALRIGQRLRLSADGTPMTVVELEDDLPTEAPPAEDLPSGETVPDDAEASRGALPLPEDEYADEPADVGPSVITTMDGREFTLTPPSPVPAGPRPPSGPPATITRVRIGAGTSGPIVVSAPTSGPQTHVVQSGETLYAIARQYGTTVEAVRALNNLRGDALDVGQMIAVGEARRPIRPPSLSGPYDVTQTTLADDEAHTVQPGETLYAIAARYGTTVGRLLAVNTLTTAPLAPGTLIALPDSVGQKYYRTPAPPLPPDEDGLALVYPQSYVGRETISGEPYDPAALTASHRTLPFGTVLHVTMPATRRSVLVRVNDRGPVSEGFLIELSEAAAEAIGQNPGAAERVEVRVVQ